MPETGKRRAKNSEIRVKVSDAKSDDKPVVVSFPRGIPESLQDKNAAEVPKFVWQKLSEKTRLGRRIIGYDATCVYISEAEGLAYDERLTKLCIGVYNKKTSQLVLHESAVRGTVFSLEQSVPSYSRKRASTTSHFADARVEYGALFEDFGSSKKRKVLKSQRANQVEIDHVVGAGENSTVVDRILKGNSMSKSNQEAVKSQSSTDATEALSGAQVAINQARRQFLPPYDESATEAHLVYNAKSIVGDAAWRRASREVRESLQTGDPIQEVMSKCKSQEWKPCVSSLIQQIPVESGTASERFTIALALNWMINFYLAFSPKRSIKPPDAGQNKVLGVPVEMVEHSLAAFATETTNDVGETRYTMTKANKDKCLVHVLLLYMMARGREMKIPDLRPVTKDLQLMNSAVTQLLRMAGCTVSKTGKGASSAVLTAPIEFPKPKRAGGNRGRA